MTETQEKILDTAERLFGEQGYAATSLRHIIADAGVNLAAIHYHFGSKEDLLDQLVMRKAGPVNEERLALLAGYEEAAGSAPPTVEQILQAFLAPPLSRMSQSPCFGQLMGRMYAEGMMPVIAEKHFQNVKSRFFTALSRALPYLTAAELGMRVQFLIGTMAHTLISVRQTDSAILLRELIVFLSGGLRAPAVVERTEEK